MKNQLPAVVVDTREQRPFSFDDGIIVELGTLASGDYSLRGLEELCAIERKSLPDLVSCCTGGRDRFKRELARLRGFRCKAVIVETDLRTIMQGRYRSQVKPAAILGSLASWQTKYSIPFWLAGDHGAETCLAILRTFHSQLCEFMRAIMPE